MRLKDGGDKITAAPHTHAHTHICVYVCLTNTHFHTNTLNLSLLCSKTLEYTKKDDSNTHMERRDVGRQGGGYGGERESFNGTKLNANIVNN